MLKLDKNINTYENINKNTCVFVIYNQKNDQNLGILRDK